MSQVMWYPGHQVFQDDIVEARNCSLFDAEGARWVDLESGVWCATIGHCHPRVLQALTDQAGRVSHSGFNYSCRIVEEAAQEVLAVVGFRGGKCTFLSSGSEAVEYAVRVARMITERPRFVTMADSYFGAYGAASERTNEGWHGFDWSGCADCPDSARCEADCERWASIPWDTIGAFVFEPGSSSGNVRFPPAKLVSSFACAVWEVGGLVLVNEVTTGMGRTGEWFGFEHYEIVPDMVVLGKSIGNGYPVSVAAFAPDVVRALGDRSVLYAQSHQNDPLGAAVAREVIQTIRDEQLLERGREIGDLLRTGLEEIKDRTGRIEEIRARGLMLAIQLKDAADTQLTIHTQQELARRGYLVARRSGLNILRLDPALTIERGDIESFLDELEDILSKYEDPAA